MIAPAEIPSEEVHARTILIVDDDLSVTDTFTRILEIEGYHVAVAHDVERGVELADNVRPDGIILDMRMPIANGLQFLRRVRAKAHLAEIPICIVTGDYFLPDATQREIASLGVALEFKPMWLEKLVVIARKLVP